MRYDFLIVGSGPAGCVLVNRLSADSSCQVALLEAGPDFGASRESWPPSFLDASQLPGDGDGWHYKGGTVELPRARSIGGSSAINGCLWIRGSAADYDHWASLGNPGWWFDDLLPWFKKAESDPLGGPLHGSNGPVPVSRIMPNQQTQFERRLVSAAGELGIPETLDLNGDRVQTPAVGPGPCNTADGVRLNSVFTYLNPVRNRSNLTVLANTEVDRLLLDGTRVTGVLTATGRTIEAEEVILSAGAYGSPSILMRSGVGNAAELRSLDIPPVVDLPGVGINLLDHPKVDGCLEAWIDSEIEPPKTSFQDVVVVPRSSYSSDEIDLHIYSGQSWVEEARRWNFWATASLQRSRSRGTVKLRSAEPGDPPIIDHNWFSEPLDLEIATWGVEFIDQLLRTSQFRDLLTPRADKSLTWSSRDDLRQQVKAHVGTTFHPCGTCKLGPESDPEAVVDGSCRVRGLEGVRVIDASVFPTIPRANIHFPIVAISEKMAAEIA